MDQTVTTTSGDKECRTEDALGENGVRRCSVCGYTEPIGIPGITYGRIGPYSGICWDCLTGERTA